MKKLLWFVPLLLVMVIACKNSIAVNNVDRSISQIITTKIKRYTVDSGSYTDVTMKNVDASLIDKSAFDSLTKNNYRGKNCVMNIDKTSGKIHVAVDNTQMKEYEGKKIECTFEYEIKSSGSNTVYICPKNRGNTVCYIDGKENRLNTLPAFMFYIPLYGFGENRIEVSSIMKNEGAVNCQTLWVY